MRFCFEGRYTGSSSDSDSESDCFWPFSLKKLLMIDCFKLIIVSIIVIFQIQCRHLNKWSSWGLRYLNLYHISKQFTTPSVITVTHVPKQHRAPSLMNATIEVKVVDSSDVGVQGRTISPVWVCGRLEKLEVIWRKMCDNSSYHTRFQQRLGCKAGSRSGPLYLVSAPTHVTTQRGKAPVPVLAEIFWTASKKTVHVAGGKSLMWLRNGASTRPLHILLSILTK